MSAFLPMAQVYPVSAFRDNYIWIAADEGSHPRSALIVDPGDAQPVIAALEKDGLRAAAILITHHHWDHVGGVAQLRTRYDVPVYGPAGENIPVVTEVLRDGDTVRPAPGLPAFSVMEVPGHTAGHIAYWGDDLLFCGDTLFAGGCGRLFEGTAAQLFESLERLAALPDDSLVYCAHEYTLNNLRFAMEVDPDNEPLRARLRDALALREQGKPTLPTTLALEKRTNPFLRCREPDIAAAVERFAEKKLRPGAEVFTALRYWKDTWSG